MLQFPKHAIISGVRRVPPRVLIPGDVSGSEHFAKDMLKQSFTVPSDAEEERLGESSSHAIAHVSGMLDRTINSHAIANDTGIFDSHAIASPPVLVDSHTTQDPEYQRALCGILGTYASHAGDECSTPLMLVTTRALLHVALKFNQPAPLERASQCDPALSGFLAALLDEHTTIRAALEFVVSQLAQLGYDDQTPFDYQRQRRRSKRNCRRAHEGH